MKLLIHLKQTAEDFDSDQVLIFLDHLPDALFFIVLYIPIILVVFLLIFFIRYYVKGDILIHFNYKLCHLKQPNTYSI